MSYNWISASTAEGRERLKERTNKGIIVARMAFAPDEIGQCYWMDMSRLNLCGEIVRNWEEAEAENYADDGRSILDCIEFLDPEPRQPELKPLEWHFSSRGKLASAKYCQLAGLFFAENLQPDVWTLFGSADGKFPTFEALSAHVEALRREALKKLLK